AESANSHRNGAGATGCRVAEENVRGRGTGCQRITEGPKDSFCGCPVESDSAILRRINDHQMPVGSAAGTDVSLQSGSIRWVIDGGEQIPDLGCCASGKGEVPSSCVDTEHSSVGKSSS